MQPLYEWLGLTASLGFVDIVDYEYQKGKNVIYMNMILYIQLMDVSVLII